MKLYSISNILIALACMFFYFSAFSQTPNRQKFPGRSRVNNSQQGNTIAPELKTAFEKFKEIKAEFDSTDFEYAILVNDNAGIFAARQDGQNRSNFLKMIGHVGNVLKNSKLSNGEIAKINLDVGRTCFALGRFVLASKILGDAKMRFERNGVFNENYIETISSLALVYISMRRQKLADSFLVKALAIRENSGRATGATIAPVLNNRAVLDLTNGRYNKSELAFDNAMKLLQSRSTSMAYAIVLNNQAMLYQSVGRYEEAKNNLLKAIEIAKKTDISRARNHLRFYTNLALLYQHMNSFDEAEKIYHLLEDKYDKSSTEFANLQNNFAILLWVRGKEERVEPMLRNAARLLRMNLSENDLAYAKAIGDLGNYYRFKGSNDSASLYLEKALQIRRKLMGAKHPGLIQNMEDLAVLYWKKKEWGKAMQIYNAVIEKTIDFINTYFTAMSDAEKSRYWDVLLPRFLRCYNFLVEASKYGEEAIAQMFRFRMATKGILLNSARKVSQSILTSGDDQLITDYEEWIDLKEQLAGLYSYSNEELKEQNINIDSLEGVANLLEKKLSFNSRSFSDYNFINRVTIADLRTGLKPDEAVLEVIRLTYFDQNFTDSCRYVGLIITKNNPKPGLVVIPNGSALENVAARTYKEAIRNKTADEESYSFFWKPFDESLKDKKRIYISLDGIYNQVNLNTLKKPGGDYLISEYDLVLVGNPKDILPDSSNRRSANVKNATLVGYPDYGSEMIPELPGTLVEVDSIHRVLRSSGYKVAEFIQQNATETNLKQVKKVSVLHIATHGYFLQDVIKTYWPIGVAEENAKNNVLLRSGLLLAGAANTDRAKANLDTVNNGVLTSYEAMNLDLAGTDLVVLSACETGLGEIKAGEGVYGLQRAFLEAGAGTLVMSLWKVDDRATQQLMNMFYNNWIRTGDRQKAFKDAQLQLKQTYPAPFYWGAFVMMHS